jgi:hypothetical protein
VQKPNYFERTFFTNGVFQATLPPGIYKFDWVWATAQSGANVMTAPPSILGAGAVNGTITQVNTFNPTLNVTNTSNRASNAAAAYSVLYLNESQFQTVIYQIITPNPSQYATISITFTGGTGATGMTNGDMFISVIPSYNYVENGVELIKQSHRAELLQSDLEEEKFSLNKKVLELEAKNSEMREEMRQFMCQFKANQAIANQIEALEPFDRTIPIQLPFDEKEKE